MEHRVPSGKKQLISASDGGFVALHSEQREKARFWSLHRDHLVTAIRWRPKVYDQFASAGFDNTVRVWRLTDTDPELVVELPQSSHVRCIAFSPDGNLLAAGCDDGKIRLWDVKQKTSIVSLEGHRDKVRCLAFSCDGNHLMSGANDRQIIRWSMQDFSPVESESVPSKPICCTFDRTEDRFVFGTEAGMLGFRSWRAPNLHQDVIASSSPIRSVAISADGSTVASGCQDGNVSLWNTETGLKLVDFPAEQSSQSAVLSLSFSHDNEVIAAGLYSGAVITSENTTATR